MSDFADVLRAFNVFLCTAVFAGLLWRMVGRWTLSWPLARWVTGLFAALELILALGIAYRARAGGPFNPVQYLVVLHSLVSLGVVWAWPRLMQGTHLERPHKGGTSGLGSSS